MLSSVKLIILFIIIIIFYFFGGGADFMLCQTADQGIMWLCHIHDFPRRNEGIRCLHGSIDEEFIYIKVREGFNSTNAKLNILQCCT